MHPDHPETKRLTAGFDQAWSRGLLASDIVSGLAQKHDLPRERILATLEALRRVDTSIAQGELVCWPAETPSHAPAGRPSAAVAHHAEAALLQAAIDYAVHHGLITPDRLRQVHPNQLFRTVLPLVAGHHGEQEASGKGQGSVAA